MKSRLPAFVSASAAAALLMTPTLAGPVEIYGRPLRGLTQVRVADVLRNPEAFTKPFRISGRCERRGASLAVRDGDASIALEAVRFSVPGDAVGARISAEGSLAKDDPKNPARFLADGVEVTR